MHRFLCLLLSALLLTSCRAVPKDPAAQTLPSPAVTPPLLTVYIVADGALAAMDVETYVAGVVAGEMPNTWPLEALKAQAILARTFVLKFVTEKDSRYPGADISTDIAEAQAYDAAAVNDRILAAVRDTAGLVLLTGDGAQPYTWFHARSGGVTGAAVAGIDWQGSEPSYTRVTEGRDSPDAPASAKAWTAAFSAGDFAAACRKAGYPVDRCSTVRIGQKGPSGRAVTLWVDGTEVNAARLRISLGSTVMRSTLLSELVLEDGLVHMSGLGYGHGVGMPQWGAYALAQDGWRGEDIALHYYTGLHLIRAW